jgi:hypothetical protein
MTLTGRCAAPPEAVYGRLADLRSHLSWAGAEQLFGFRLLSLDAPPGQAAPGATFSSTGSIPMSGRRWNDRSTVTVAVPNSTFEFVTEAQNGSGARAMRATYRHRYDIEPAGPGCRVTYTLVEESVTKPILRMGAPGLRRMTWKFGVPMMAGRGFRNLLRSAEAPVARASSRRDTAEAG